MPRNTTFLCTALAILIANHPASLNAQEQQKELLFGSVAMDIPAVMHKRLSPLTDYLSKSLGKPVALKLSPNMPAAIKDTIDGAVDLSYLTPVAYLDAHANGNARLIVKTITNGEGAFKLMIVVKENSPIKSVAELAGKTFAFGDKAALLQRAVVIEAGMPLEKFREYKFIGHYDNIVRAVINGDFDAGIVKDTMAYKWKDQGIRILYSSADLPPYNISASKNVDDAMLEKLRKAFLRLDKNKPEHLAVIKAIDESYDGFAPTSDAEYDIIRKLIKPFEKQK
jgi:phosphonate transport system substrate-binding protein